MHAQSHSTLMLFNAFVVNYFGKSLSSAYFHVCHICLCTLVTASLLFDGLTVFVSLCSLCCVHGLVCPVDPLCLFRVYISSVAVCLLHSVIVCFVHRLFADDCGCCMIPRLLVLT